MAVFPHGGCDEDNDRVRYQTVLEVAETLQLDVSSDSVNGTANMARLLVLLTDICRNKTAAAAAGLKTTANNGSARGFLTEAQGVLTMGPLLPNGVLCLLGIIALYMLIMLLVMFRYTGQFGAGYAEQYQRRSLFIIYLEKLIVCSWLHPVVKVCGVGGCDYFDTSDDTSSAGAAVTSQVAPGLPVAVTTAPSSCRFAQAPRKKSKGRSSSRRAERKMVDFSQNTDLPPLLRHTVLTELDGIVAESREEEGRGGGGGGYESDERNPSVRCQLLPPLSPPPAPVVSLQAATKFTALLNRVTERVTDRVTTTDRNLCSLV